METKKPTRYGVISDTHGNIAALDAVLAHAQQQRVDGYIFLGDYGGFGNTNATVERLQSLEKAATGKDSFFILSGNGEEYIRKNYHNALENIFPKQLAPIQQECRTIEPDKMEYLLQLPKTIQPQLWGSDFYMAHSPADIFGKSVLDFSCGRNFINLTENGKLNNCSYNDYIITLATTDTDFLQRVSSFQQEVFLFGHYHTQWHGTIGGKLFVNPGSCGMPCDYDIRAPYTILEYTKGHWTAHEQRVAYDVENAAWEYKQTEYFKSISIWGELYGKVIETGMNWPLLFLEHLDKVALENGEDSIPHSDKVWEKAMQSWNWK